MAEEPEHVLEHHRIAAAGRIEEAGAEIMIRQQHGHRAGQHRHDGDQQIGGDEPGQQNSGILSKFMPGARMFMMVTITLMAPMIDEAPIK